MTDVPEHLLARSRERRAALGLGGEGGDAPASTPAAGVEAAGSPTPSGAVTPARAAAAAPVVVEPPRPDPPYVAAAKRRPRVPVFVAPVIAALPVFAFVYWGALSPKPAPADPQLALGAEVYAANCAACHGADGGGGTGRPLNEVVTVFPDAADQITWITNGSQDLAPGTPYGVGRQAKQDGYGVMPGFAGSLSEEEIVAVTRYQRERFGGEAPPLDAAAGESGADG